MTERNSIGSGPTYLECPCCGGYGAASDGEGMFFDGQPLICGCVGWVSVDEDGDVWINNGDDPCSCAESLPWIEPVDPRGGDTP